MARAIWISGDCRRDCSIALDNGRRFGPAVASTGSALVWNLIAVARLAADWMCWSVSFAGIGGVLQPTTTNKPKIPTHFRRLAEAKFFTVNFIFKTGFAKDIARSYWIMQRHRNRMVPLQKGRRATG